MKANIKKAVVSALLKVNGFFRFSSCPASFMSRLKNMNVIAKLMISNGDSLMIIPGLPVINSIKIMFDIIDDTIASIEPLKVLSRNALLFADLPDSSLIVVFALTNPPSKPTIDSPLLYIFSSMYEANDKPLMMTTNNQNSNGFISPHGSIGLSGSIGSITKAIMPNSIVECNSFRSSMFAKFLSSVPNDNIPEVSIDIMTAMINSFIPTNNPIK